MHHVKTKHAVSEARFLRTMCMCMCMQLVHCGVFAIQGGRRREESVLLLKGTVRHGDDIVRYAGPILLSETTSSFIR